MRCLLVGFSVLGFASPVFAQPDLNSQLLSAVCDENWNMAIRVVGRMQVAYPDSASELAEYRRRLNAISRSGERVRSVSCKVQTQFCSPGSASNVIAPGRAGRSSGSLPGQRQLQEQVRQVIPAIPVIESPIREDSKLRGFADRVRSREEAN
jgi:hypothetical protein